MEDLFKEMFEKAKSDKKILKEFKNLCVKYQCLELASKLREMEKELFPPTKEQSSAKERGERLKLLFAMVELNIHEDIAWLIGETMKLEFKKKGKFSVMDAAELIVKRKNLFEIDK